MVKAITIISFISCLLFGQFPIQEMVAPMVKDYMVRDQNYIEKEIGKPVLKYESDYGDAYRETWFYVTVDTQMIMAVVFRSNFVIIYMDENGQMQHDQRYYVESIGLTLMDNFLLKDELMEKLNKKIELK